MMSLEKTLIRLLNDSFRRDFSQGVAVMTNGVAQMGADAAERIFQTVAAFDDFSHENDPHHEHDFGAFRVDGHDLYFKIDYYDKTMEMASPDPANLAVTTRVLVLMLASEY
jgi:hypothetical protein